MKKSVLFLVLVYSSISLPQNIETQAIIAPQGFGINLLNSSGNSSIDNDISNIGFMNPAAISNFYNFSFGFSYQEAEVAAGKVQRARGTRNDKVKTAKRNYRAA